MLIINSYAVRSVIQGLTGPNSTLYTLCHVTENVRPNDVTKSIRNTLPENHQDLSTKTIPVNVPDIDIIFWNGNDRRSETHGSCHEFLKEFYLYIPDHGKYFLTG